ncbi:MAG: ATPase [Caldilineae bacterium]|nr:MAG: ATPase [Caldilineae bacterium]
MPSLRYFLGVDIGGTKSHALIADETGRATGFGRGGPGNHEAVGWEGFRDVLQGIVDEALVQAGVPKQAISAAGFGIAGYDWPSERAPMEEVIATLGLDASFELVNDAMLGVLAGTSEGWGVGLSAGTSNNCWGRDRQGRVGRVTGAGAQMGEYGGAIELVQRAVHMVAREWTRRGPPTRLTQAFIGRTGALNIADLLEGLVLGRYHLSAADAPLVFATAAAGDPVAIETVRWAGHELGSLAVGVIRQLGLEQTSVEVVLAGSLFGGSPLLIEATAETIHSVAPRARLVKLTAPPVVGGVLLAMETLNLPKQRIRPRLITSTLALISDDRD